MKNKIILNFLFILFFLNSCITPKDTNLLQDIEKNYPVADLEAADYKIIPGDQLSLIVYTLDENMKTLFSLFIPDRPLNTNQATWGLRGGSGSMMNVNTSTSGNNNYNNIPYNVLNVSGEGNINIPYIGEVNVLGMSVLEAKKIISDKFTEFSPSVTVDVALRNRYFFVLGEMGAKAVRMPNLRMTVFQALAETGDIGVYGDRKKVKIIRQTATGTQVKTFDIRSQDIVNSDFYYIQPNDVIYAPQMQRKFFGSITSFTGVFAFISTIAGTVLGVWAIIDKVK